MGKYEEALERARAGKPIDEVFPELKESEDERIRKWLIAEIKLTHDYDSPTSAKCVDDAIAWLERQKEQKPAEWSEEDEKTLEKLHRLLVICRGEKKFIQEVDYNKMDNLLKSLRPKPHWKPSEEQMRALENVIKCEVSAGLHVRAEIIQSLLNDLKKL